jgi:cyclophilin family peptidyl-prolyl cis-trans isomerase
MAIQQQQRQNLSIPLSRSKQSITNRNPLVVAIVTIVGLVFVAFAYLFLLQRILVKQPASAVAINNNQANAVEADTVRIREVQAHDGASEVLGGTLVLTTKLGAIKIKLRPDLSAESCRYLHQLVALPEPCPDCKFYRAEKPGILQGIMANKPKLSTKDVVVRGPCPVGVESVVNKCPPWDKDCGCHGPIMIRGMVAWAGGATGPDFFIDAYMKPADFWGTQHTVFGQIEDMDSFDVIEQVWKQPAKNDGGMTMLDEKLHFTLQII